MRPAGLLAVQSIRDHQLRQLQKVGNPPSLLQLLVEPVVGAGHPHVAPELFAQLLYLFQGPFQPGLAA